jgi:hypothetical protein
VWAVLGDLTSVDRWVPGVTTVTRTASGRVCTFADGHTLDEQILDYSAQDRSYRYVIDGAPLPVRENVGRFAVEAAHGHARVVWESRLEPVDPAAAGELARAWEPFPPIVLTNLKNAVEGR